MVTPQDLFKDPGFDLLEQTLRLTRIAHASQLYNHQPYWHHPVRVALRMVWPHVDTDDLYVALGHDWLEDTNITVHDLRYFGYSDWAIWAMQCLTRDEEVSYKDYIRGIIETGDLSLMRIKLCDLFENSNNVRFLPTEKRKVLVRYGKSIKEILEALNQTHLGRELVKYTISGELDGQTLESWIGQPPTFL
jgi:(p)ppGpp synthase/HD superfamily hydrolase